MRNHIVARFCSITHDHPSPTRVRITRSRDHPNTVKASWELLKLPDCLPKPSESLRRSSEWQAMSLECLPMSHEARRAIQVPSEFVENHTDTIRVHPRSIKVPAETNRANQKLSKNYSNPIFTVVVMTHRCRCCEKKIATLIRGRHYWSCLSDVPTTRVQTENAIIIEVLLETTVK